MLSKEEYIKKLYSLLESDDADVKIDARYELEQLINEHFDNPPLKFEDLKENEWYWDNQYREYVQTDRYDDWDECYWVWHSGDEMLHKIYEDVFDENRFYRFQINE